MNFLAVTCSGRTSFVQNMSMSARLRINALNYKVSMMAVAWHDSVTLMVRIGFRDR